VTRARTHPASGKPPVALGGAIAGPRCGATQIPKSLSSLHLKENILYASLVDAQKFAQFRDLGGTCSREGFYLYLTGRNSRVIHSQSSTYKFTIDRRPDPVVSLCVLSRRNLSYPSRRSTPNSSLINRLEPLCFLFPTPVLCFQQLATSFPKTPGVGVPVEKFRVSDPPTCRRFRTPTPSFLITSLQPLQFQAITHSFAQRRSAILPVLNSFRTLSIATGVVPSGSPTTHYPLPTTHYPLSCLK